MVTLDIGDTYIRMMVVKGRRVEAAGSLPLEPGLVRDGVITDTLTVSQRVSELMATLGVSEKNVITGVSGIHSIYRVANLPRLSKGLLDAAAKYEMERAMPVPLNELYTSWQAIALSDIETALCMVGLHLNTIDAMLETLSRAGLDSKAIDVTPLALARVTDEKDAIIVSVQPTGFDIVIMTDGIPELLHSLSFSAANLPMPDKIAEVKEELDRTVAFHNSSHKGNPITPTTAAFISGELGDTMAQALQYRIKPLPRLLAYSDNLNTGEYAVNIGLALKQTKADISQARVNINVTPEIYLPKPLPIMQVVSWLLVVVGIAILIPLTTSTINSVAKASALEGQVRSAQTQVQARQGTEAALEKLQTQIKDIKATRDALKQPLDSAKAQRVKANGDLSKVTSLLPGTIELKSISYSPNVTVNGIAPDDTIILGYVRGLRNSGQFSEVLISDMKEIAFNKWDFTLTLK
jgi:type IV pilus assembly protein PilM